MTQKYPPNICSLFEVAFKNELRRVIEERIEIFRVSFAFDNRSLLELLQKRGAILQQCEKKAPKQLKAIDGEIDELISRNYEKFVEPVRAFITLKDVQHLQRAKESISQAKLFGEHIQIRDSPEPCNIIWENYGQRENNIIW